ncbi:hypothetical protein CAL29_05260 [Bordetella genomosp. 10]|uniref:DUF1275 family protein n=1 Tax=Bordetella genomosp. 10 TaxID=1416804 RepID=A0A261SKU4_9BORD|nr:hypothetical protein CAL29_05260 [Bordetella genomosp. 10]
MPIIYLRRLTSVQRSPMANQHLACYLAFVAGAVNAGGFLAVKQYTSHMSGVVATMSDSLALGQIDVVLNGAAALLSFLLGAGTSAVLINLARRAGLASVFALPLVLEAGLLLAFGLAGARLDAQRWSSVSMTVVLLCYIMGLQNAMITKVSKAEIRTTHITGMVTDIGIELGKLFYWNRMAEGGGGDRVWGDRKKLRILGALVGLFFLGGLVGAVCFKEIGFISTLPLAVLVLLLGIVPVWDDIRKRVAH